MSTSRNGLVHLEPDGERPVPSLAGHGPTLYESGLPSARRLELISAKSLCSGVVAMHYRRELTRKWVVSPIDALNSDGPRVAWRAGERGRQASERVRLACLSPTIRS